jgi:opacity protein-like surface antigen
MKKRFCVVCMVLMAAILLAMAGVAQSAMWVGGEIGGNFPTDTKLRVTSPYTGGSADIDSVGFKSAVIGGVTIGYDFVNSGFGAYAWPDWMKYFSFAMDWTYNSLNIPEQTVSGTALGGAFNNVPLGRVSGHEFVWTFLFMGHVGFMPDSEVPSGRINPYIGVGPAIVWVGIDGGNLSAAGVGATVGGASSTNLALVVEPGIRWVALKNVSIDTAMRWRYCVPSVGGDILTVKADPLNQFTFLVRANYHF